MAQVGGKRLVVLGGGLAGLSFVHYLRNFSAFFKKESSISKITLLEANDYMGGSIKSCRYEDGVIHELGPRSVRLAGFKGHNTATLLEQLGLKDRVLSITQDSAAGRNRYIYDNERLYRIPSSISQIFSRLPNSNQTLGAALFRDFFKAPKMNLDEVPDRDPTIYDFIKHRFGEEMAAKVSDPVMRGITAGDARKLSTRAIIGDFLDKEQIYGSVIKGVYKPPVTKSFHDELFPNDLNDSRLLNRFQRTKVLSYNLSTGLQTLPEHLTNSLLNTNQDGLISIFNQTKAVSLQFNQPNDPELAPCDIEVETVDGDRMNLPADYVISSIPSKDFAKILPPSMPDYQREALKDIVNVPHAPVGCVSVEYRGIKGKLPNIVNSFGFLTNSKSSSRVLGISFDTTMFPQIDEPNKSTRFTCMIGGSWFKEVLGTDNLDQVTNAQLEQIALEEIRKILKINLEPHRVSTLLWKTGIAQYLPGHTERLENTRKKLKELQLPLILIGQSYDGIAVNDVVFAARLSAYNLIKSL